MPKLLWKLGELFLEPTFRTPDLTLGISCTYYFGLFWSNLIEMNNLKWLRQKERNVSLNSRLAILSKQADKMSRTIDERSHRSSYPIERGHSLACLPEAGIQVLSFFAPLFSQRVWLRAELLFLV